MPLCSSELSSPAESSTIIVRYIHVSSTITPPIVPYVLLYDREVGDVESKEQRHEQPEHRADDGTHEYLPRMLLDVRADSDR